MASDLYMWSMSEFRFVDIADTYCSSSSIMPQKKNAWALAWIRGQGSLACGRLGGVFTLAKTESDGLEDTLMGPWQLYEALDELTDMDAMLAGVVATMTVDVARLRERLVHGWNQATDLAAMLTREAGISWREAHQIVARLVRERVDAGQGQEDVTPAHISDVAAAVIGRPLNISADALRSAADAEQSVHARAVIEGSPAPANVAAQIEAGRQRLAGDVARIEALAERNDASAARLQTAVDAIVGGADAKGTS